MTRGTSSPTASLESISLDGCPETRSSQLLKRLGLRKRCADFPNFWSAIDSPLLRWQDTSVTHRAFMRYFNRYISPKIEMLYRWGRSTRPVTVQKAVAWLEAALDRVQFHADTMGRLWVEPIQGMGSRIHISHGQLARSTIRTGLMNIQVAMDAIDLQSGMARTRSIPFNARDVLAAEISRLTSIETSRLMAEEEAERRQEEAEQEAAQQEQWKRDRAYANAEYAEETARQDANRASKSTRTRRKGGKTVRVTKMDLTDNETKIKAMFTAHNVGHNDSMATQYRKARTTVDPALRTTALRTMGRSLRLKFHPDKKLYATGEEYEAITKLWQKTHR